MRAPGVLFRCSLTTTGGQTHKVLPPPIDVDVREEGELFPWGANAMLTESEGKRERGERGSSSERERYYIS